ncbi:hypothetical protein Tco_1189571, partial [Tanacetum coccineum]
ASGGTKGDRIVDRLSDAPNRAEPAESGDSCEGKDTVEGDEMLRVHGERTQGVVKTLMNTKTKISYDLVIFREEHQCRLLRREAWSSFEVSVGITKVTYLRFFANFSKIVKLITSLTKRNQKKERVKPRRVRAMAMTIQYGVRGMILTAQSEAFKQENVPLVGSEMDEAHASRYLVHLGADEKYYNIGDMYWWP